MKIKIETERHKTKKLVIVRVSALVDGTREPVLIGTGSGETKEIAAGWCARNIQIMCNEATDELDAFGARTIVVGDDGAPVPS